MAIAGRRVGRGRSAVPVASLLVPAVAAVAGIAFLAWKPGVARSMLGSPRALGFTVVVGGLVVGLGWVLPRLGRGPRTTALAQAVPVVLAFVVTVLPAFRDVTADDAFPGATDAAGPASAAASPAPVATSTAAPPTVVARASLHGIDHRAAGRVLLVRAGARSFVRLEQLDVEPGPDYQVHVVPGAGRVRPDGGVHLGRLRANKGALNYELPGDAQPGRPFTVLVWCRAFAVPVAAATLT